MASNSDTVRRRRASADRNRRRNSLPDLSQRNDRDRRSNPRNIAQDDAVVANSPAAPRRAQNRRAANNIAQDIEREALRRKEPDNDTINQLIARESNGNVRALRALYDAGASSDDIRFLLQREPNAQVLNTRIQAEANKSVANLRQLYAIQNMTSRDVTEMLALESDAARIHQLATNTHPKVRVNNFQHVSMIDGKTGSMYFNDGRIRLTHASGPMPNLDPARVRRYHVTRADKQAFDAWIASERARLGGLPTRQATANYVTNLGSADEITNVNALPTTEQQPAPYLIEISYNNNGEVENIHPSRGGAVRLPHNMSQHHVNIIYNLSREAAANIAPVLQNYKTAKRNRNNALGNYNRLEQGRRRILAELNRAQTQVDNATTAATTARNALNTARQEARFPSFSNKVKNAQTRYDTLNRQLQDVQNQFDGVAQRYQTTAQATSQARTIFQRIDNDYQTGKTRINQANTRLYNWIKGMTPTRFLPIRRADEI